MSKKNYIESNILEYNGIKTISGFDCVVNGETDSLFYNKEFRYSNDKILWSDYKKLTNENLKNISIIDNNFYIQYRFTKNGDGELSVENISLHVEYNGDDGGIPECHWTTIKMGNRYTPQIVYTQNQQNLFNPYNIGQSFQLFNQMSSLVSNMFGICVLYFKTEANSKSRDVVLKEYSIEKVVDKQNVKILIPDNSLPTKEQNFSQFMIDYPVQFEVHIVKSEFRKIFGQDSHPDPHDYLYFQSYMNRMYMVDSVSEPDDFGYVGTYWRVSLVPYQEMSSVKFDDEDLQNDTENIIFSAEGKFKEEMDDEIMDNRKDNQLNDVGDWQEGQDPLRRMIDPNIRIRDEKIYNDWTVISENFYDLSTIKRNKIANEYKYTTGFGSKDERMISFIFRPLNTIKNISENIMIENVYGNNNGNVSIKLNSWSNLLDVGNFVKISRVGGIKDLVRISSINKSKKIIDIDLSYNDSIRKFSCAKLVSYSTNNMLSIRNDENVLFSMNQINDGFILNIDNKKYTYTFEDFKGFENKWYALIWGSKNGMSNIWLYDIMGSNKKENVHTKFKYIGRSSNDLGSFDFGKKCYYDIIACDMNLTNFRLWKKLCEEDTQELILSQYIIDDTHNTLIVDNARHELLLNNKWS